MALTIDNDGNPIIVTGDTAIDTEIYDSYLMIKFIKWHRPVTAGHVCVLTDSNGREIVKFVCETDLESQWAPIWSYFQDLHCNDMDSGTLYIYTK